MNPSGTGKRERNKELTRQTLAECADKLFAKKGFDKTTVDEIAAMAGVGRRTFFRYYPTKEAVFFAYREQWLDQFQALVQEAPKGKSVYRMLSDVLLQVAAGFMENRDEIVKRQQIIAKSPYLLAKQHEIDLQWEAAIAQVWFTRAGGGAEGKRRAMMAAGALMGVVRAVFRQWHASGGEMDVVEAGRDAFAELERGRLFVDIK